MKLFKSIRKVFITKSNTRNYILYAIGEITLVVLGILIAVQIDDWNDLRIKKEKEKVFLKEIISDLDFNISYAEEETKETFGVGRDSILKIYDHVIEHIESRKPLTNFLEEAFFMLHQLPFLDVKSSGYETLKFSGLDIIQSDKLRSSIGEYYTVTAPSTQSVYKELRDDFYNYMLEFPRTKFITKLDESGTYIQEPVNYQMLLENTEYVESLKMFTGIYDLNLRVTKDYTKQTKALKQEIENYLKSN